MEQEKLIQEISRQIGNIINSSVRNLEREDDKWKDYYNECILDILDEIEKTKQALRDYKDEGWLKLTALEMEGYLRGLITMKNMFEQHKPK